MSGSASMGSLGIGGLVPQRKPLRMLSVGRHVTKSMLSVSLLHENNMTSVFGHLGISYKIHASVFTSVLHADLPRSSINNVNELPKCISSKHRPNIGQSVN